MNVSKLTKVKIKDIIVRGRKEIVNNNKVISKKDDSSQILLRGIFQPGQHQAHQVQSGEHLQSGKGL